MNNMYVLKIKLNKVYRGYFMSNDKVICYLNLRGIFQILKVLYLIGYCDLIFIFCVCCMILGKYINLVVYFDMSNEV